MVIDLVVSTLEKNYYSVRCMNLLLLQLSIKFVAVIFSFILNTAL